MRVLRSLIVVELLACIYLYLVKSLGIEWADESVFTTWVFILAYPMVYGILVPFLILLVANIYRLVSKKHLQAIGWIIFDTVLVTANFAVFQGYYAQITQM
ncbi:hypothetical protein [Bowmanella pacifica]|uniref:Uncharacterized protein n=1 Tax=Bowmanella pacifica TaxID=502051 RepID=A0A918DIA3_9ALTE|nr:hypothetical protein [Bowmanella pacifica]GGO67671.1 hypothetical protein GCM10010982_14690 [Bowmanella pacifica]